MRIRDHLHIDRLWSRAPIVAVLRFEGVIMPRPRRGGVSLASHAAAIERAFRVSNLVAVAVVVNSPGGSAVQSALLYRRIRELAEEKHVPVVAFAEDVAASGGYWLALAGDEIFSEETSILGSIGVISASFGFSRLIEKLGVERRLHTAGERKSLLDPFLPQKPSDVERLTVLQQDITVEQCLVLRVDLPGAPALHMLLEGAMDVLLQHREPLDIGRFLRKKRV